MLETFLSLLSGGDMGLQQFLGLLQAPLPIGKFQKKFIPFGMRWLLCLWVCFGFSCNKIIPPLFLLASYVILSYIYEYFN